MSSILVTGGAGFIGSHFVRRCCGQFPDRKIIVLDNLSEGHLESIPATPQVHFAHLDVGDKIGVEQLLVQHEVDAVVHFAASCYVGESENNPPKYFHNNVVNSLNLFAAMQTCGVRKIVYSSTCAVYGYPKAVPIDENHPLAPISVYGLTKHLVEQVLAANARCSGWSYIALRYFNAAGTDSESLVGELHEPESHLIPLALQTANGKRDSLQVYGADYDTPDGTCIRDYVHVNDLADAHCRAVLLLANQPVSEAINLGTACGASVKEVVDICKDVSGRDIQVNYCPRRGGDPPVLVANSDKAKKVLGWQPKQGLRETITSAWEWEQRKP